VIRAWSTRLRAAVNGVCATDVARAVLAALFVAAIIYVAHVFGFTLCPLKRLSGVPCPCCGSTRAIVALLHGDATVAFAIQPLATVVACLLVPSLLASMVLFGRCRTNAFLVSVARKRITWIVFALAILVNWAYVIHHGN